jgi:hypothetical protein
MKIEEYISKQAPERQALLTDIHNVIIEGDKSVRAGVEKMMGRDMIIYKGNGMMKYGLASLKNYMSLHVLPIYGSGTLYSRYKALFTRATFQKGCINFVNEDSMPLETVRQLIDDCSSFDLMKIREEYINRNKTKLKK